MSDETNILITGRPGVGKTTAVERLVERARDRGKKVSGVFSPEIREDGERVGFRVVDISTGRTRRIRRSVCRKIRCGHIGC